MSIEWVGELRKVLSLMVMPRLELIQSLPSVGDLLPVKVQFSIVAPLTPLAWAAAQKPVVSVNVQSLTVTLLALIYTVAVPKLIPLSTAPAWVTYTIFLDGE